MSLEILVLTFMALASFLSVIAAYMAVKERDLVRAVVYSALQSGFYAILYYLMAAPDISLVYIPVAVGLIPAVLLVLISKTERWEKQ